jgi:hypothetical protein
VAFDAEWNNKDPFYDRDLNNFMTLPDPRAIDVGIIVAGRSDRPEKFNALRKGPSHGDSTPQLGKLIPRLGGGCPVLVFGICRKIYVEN